MSYLILPKRAFNSPLIEYANFQDESFVNLIKLNKPYANGISYAVYETTNNPFCSNGFVHRSSILSQTGRGHGTV